MAMTRRQMLEMAASIYNYMVQGKKDGFIKKQLDLDSEDFETCKRFMLEQKAEHVRNQPREHFFIEYQAEQRHNIRDLDGLIKNLDAGSQYNAIVGAIRLRSDILDKIVDRAQEFGLVKKEANKHELVGGLVIAQLDAPALRKAIIDNTKGLAELMGKYGEKEFVALPPPGSLHYGESIDTSGESADVDPDEDLDADEKEPPKKRKLTKEDAAAIAKAAVDKAFEKRRAAKAAR